MRYLLGPRRLPDRSLFSGVGTPHGPGDDTARQRGKSARVNISTEAPTPKSLEVEHGNETSQDDVSLNDILDDVITHYQWMM